MNEQLYISNSVLYAILYKVFIVINTILNNIAETILILVEKIKYKTGQTLPEVTVQFYARYNNKYIKNYALMIYKAQLCFYSNGVRLLKSVSCKQQKEGVRNQTNRSFPTPNIVFCADYYPFGMAMEGRFGSVGNYRYGFNGMEKDDEVKGAGNSYTTEFRQLDPRTGRWWSTDPITHPQYSPYSTFDNNPIYYSDPSGADSETDPPRGGGSDENNYEGEVINKGAGCQEYIYSCGTVNDDGTVNNDGGFVRPHQYSGAGSYGRAMEQYNSSKGKPKGIDAFVQAMYNYDNAEWNLARQYNNNGFRFKTVVPIPATGGLFTLETEIGVHNVHNDDFVPFYNQTLTFNLFGGSLGFGVGFNYSKVHPNIKMYTKYGAGVRISYYYAEVTNKDLTAELGFYQKNITLLSSAVWFTEGYTGKNVKYLSKYVRSTKKPFLTLGFSIDITDELNKRNYEKLFKDLKPQIEAGFKELEKIVTGE